MNTRKIGYWLATVPLAASFAFGGVLDLVQPPEMVQGMQHLGYPAYFFFLLGVWKLAGALALLAPGTPWLKEWAYAGMFFDLTGAAVSHYVSGDAAGQVLTPVILTLVLATSYWLRPAERRLTRASAEPTNGNQESTAPGERHAHAWP